MFFVFKRYRAWKPSVMTIATCVPAISPRYSWWTLTWGDQKRGHWQVMEVTINWTGLSWDVGERQKVLRSSLPFFLHTPPKGQAIIWHSTLIYIFWTPDWGLKSPLDCILQCKHIQNKDSSVKGQHRRHEDCRGTQEASATARVMANKTAISLTGIM